jgi:hypothetical protein
MCTGLAVRHAARKACKPAPLPSMTTRKAPPWQRALQEIVSKEVPHPPVKTAA